MASESANGEGPPVARDPRFKAGRTLIQTGRANEGAVDIFATLLEVRRSDLERINLLCHRTQDIRIIFAGSIEQVWRLECRSGNMLL